MSDETITKRKVTMRSVVAVEPSPERPDGILTIEANDFVRPDFLDAYVADAKTRWQSVKISDSPDAGEAGYHGATHVPAGLDHPLAGQSFAATTPGESF
jgi:hypothetical protein